MLRRRIQQMRRLTSKVDLHSSEFKNNFKCMSELVEHLTTTVEEIKTGGTLKARLQHLKRGKMIVREIRH